MKKLFTLISAAAAVLAASTLLADTLELADGELLEGSFIGSSNGVIMFDTGAGIEAFQESEVVGVFFSSGVATAESLVNASQPSRITVPAGTRLVIRTTESIDSNSRISRLNDSSSSRVHFPQPVSLLRSTSIRQTST